MKEVIEMINQPTEIMTKKEGKYLAFRFAEEGYGIGILKIKEIIGMIPITPVRRTA